MFCSKLTAAVATALPRRASFDSGARSRQEIAWAPVHDKLASSSLLVHASETVTDQSVPEGQRSLHHIVAKEHLPLLKHSKASHSQELVGHKGLHGFLYGEGGAEAHDDDEDDIHALDNALNGKRLSVKAYIEKRFGNKKAGVYAVMSEDGAYQYIGFARSLHAALKAHSAAVGPAKCCLVETRALPAQAVANRARLQAEADKWLSELKDPPPGNAHERHLWETKAAPETETYEEKKVKLQKAMGENLGEASADPTTEQRRQHLMAAVSQDDWSSVIDAQTQETIGGQPPETFQPDDSQAAVGNASPFISAEIQQGIGGQQEAQPMTPENVDRVLDEVRPFLIADGGNVEVVDVTDGLVSLRLQGACGTCASSSSTMKLGIERALKAAFGDAMKGVEQVDAKDTSTTVFSVNSHLDMLRPAIKSYGGSVEVKEIADGQCKIMYDGPPTIGAGITAAIKNQFPDIKDVVMLQ